MSKIKKRKIHTLLCTLLSHRFLRFFLSGGLNTAITYCLYLVLLDWTSYSLSYTFAYVTGVLLSYIFNRVFVFQEHQGMRTAMLLPVVYLVQYLLSLFILWLWVDCGNFSTKSGPLIVVTATLPITYLLSKFSFLGRFTLNATKEK